MPVFNDVVRLRISQKEMARMSFNKDIGVSFCKYEKDQGEVNAIFTTSRLPGIGGLAEKDDTINNQLADLNKKVCQDAVKIKNMPNKMQTFYTFLDHPDFDGEQDHIRSKAERTKYPMRVGEFDLKEINDRFAREGKRPLTDIKAEYYSKETGQREFEFDYGQVETG